MASQGSYTAIPSGAERVAPGQVLVDVGGSRVSRGGRNRGLALLGCCGAAALVALLGLVDRAPQAQSRVSLSEKIARIAVSSATQPTQLKGGVEHTATQHTNLAASAHTLAETASGIMQAAKLKMGDLPIAQAPQLGSSGGREMQLTFVQQKKSNGLAPLLRTMGLAEDGNSTESESDTQSGNSTEAEGDDGKKQKVLGATGKDVFGGKNSSVVGFLGFSKKEPALFGIPMPIVMFLFVLTCTISCLTIGCCIARKTDILKVNKEEVGGPARPVDEEEDTRGYYWREKN